MPLYLNLSASKYEYFPKLQSHPFPVEAFFKQSVVVTCAVEKILEN
jgi:hypothetical protein